MRIIKKLGKSFQREDAHGGSGGRKLYIAEDEVKNIHGSKIPVKKNTNIFSWE